MTNTSGSPLGLSLSSSHLNRMVSKRTILNSATVLPKNPQPDGDLNVTTRLPATPASKTKAISSHLKSIFLHDWWLAKVQAEGLAVGGVASTETLGERVFCSTVIVKRHETNVLETKDGITVVISGFINRSRTHQNGFPLEICDDFLFGFPHNWEEYTAKDLGENHFNGVNGFGDSNMHSQKPAAYYIDDIDATRKRDLLSNKSDLNFFWLPRKICNKLAKWQGNISELSELIGTMEHNNIMQTTECIPKEDDKILKRSQPEKNQMHNGENEILNDWTKCQGNISEQSEQIDTMEHNALKTLECIHKDDVTTLKSSQPKDNLMHNGENRVLDITDTRQYGSPKSGGQTVMSRNSAISCGEHSVSRYKTPVSANKEKKGHLSSNCKKESNRQKKPLEDVGNSFRRITRSISKGSQKTMPLGKTEEITVNCVHTPVRKSATPVRRSARLCNLRK